MGLGQNQIVQRYSGLRTNNAILGLPIPIGFGQGRIAGKLLWYGDFTSNKAKQQGGKGLGKGGSEYVYNASIIAALGFGPVSALLNVYDMNGRFLLYSASEPYTITTPYTYTAQNAAIYGNDQGVTVSSTYSFAANDYGGSPSTLSGTQQVPLTQVSGTPSSGQYSVNPATGVYTFAAADAGKAVTVNYSFYRYIIVTEELDVIPGSPYQVTVQQASYFKADVGVNYYPSGTPFTKISSGTPTVGQYKVSGGGTYTFAAADSLQGIEIQYEYNDPNTDNNAPNQLSMTLIGGAQSQSPWSYMSGKHPSEALGYTQVATINSQNLYLGYTPQMPQYSFEVAWGYQVGGGILDANPVDCIEQILANSAFGIGLPTNFIGSTQAARACFTANSFFISPILENQSAANSVISQWLEAGMCAAFWSEGIMKLVPYCDTSQVGNGAIWSPSTQPVAAIGDNVWMSSGKDDPVKVTRTPWQDAYNRVQVAYNARVNDYNPEVLYEEDEAAIQKFGLRIEDPVRWEFVTTQPAAQYAASLRLSRNIYIRNTYEFPLPATYCWLEPMDVITLTDPTLGLNATPVRIQKIEDDPIKGLTVTAEDFIYGAAQPAYNPKQTNSPTIPEPSTADPGNTNALLLEMPNRVGKFGGNIIYGWVTGSTANWGGCHVWVSIDGTNYQLYDTIQSAAVTGTLAANITSGATSLTMNMTEPGTAMPNSSATSAAVGIPLLAIIDNASSVEFASYSSSIILGDGQWQLTGLVRGFMATQVNAHSSGALIARVDAASFNYQYDPNLYYKSLSFKFTSFNTVGMNEQSLASVTAVTITLQGLGAGAIDAGTGIFRVGNGSVPNSYIGAMAYVSTTSSITWYWDGTHGSTQLTIYRATMPPSNLPNQVESETVLPSNLAVNGLTASTSYYFFPYISENTIPYPAYTPQISWVDGAQAGGGASGSPNIAFAGSRNQAAAQFSSRNDNIPIATNPVATATTSSGSGGGSGGGNNSGCPRGDMFVEERDRGVIAVASLRANDWIKSPEGFSRVRAVQKKRRNAWIKIVTENDHAIVVTPNHIFPTQEGDAIASNLNMEAVLKTVDNGRLFLKSLSIDRTDAECISLELDSPSHLYYIGSDPAAVSILTHNIIMAPS